MQTHSFGCVWSVCIRGQLTQQDYPPIDHPAPDRNTGDHPSPDRNTGDQRCSLGRGERVTEREGRKETERERERESPTGTLQKLYIWYVEVGQGLGGGTGPESGSWSRESPVN